MTDWNIRRKDESCARCSRAFAEGEALFSVLRIAAAAFGRDDFCRPCFASADAEEPAEERIWWRTRRRAAVRRGLAVDFEAVEGLFVALADREEARLAELRYVLSLLLLRKRRLKLLRVVRRDGGERMVVRRPRRAEEIEVLVFDLGPERAGELRGELEGLFAGAGREDLLAARAASAAGAEETAPPGAGENRGAPSP
ncbi:MAG: hypothetical protein AB1726_06115 [Planctomycetota bacterium]